MNHKIIKIGDREVGFKINSAILYLYKEVFGEEFLVDVAKLNKEKEYKKLCLQILFRIEWCMAYLYDKSTPPIITWLEEFPYGMFKPVEIWKELMPLIGDNLKVDRKNE